MPIPEAKPAEGQLSVTAAEFGPNSSCHLLAPVHAVPDLASCRERPCSGAQADLDRHGELSISQVSVGISDPPTYAQGKGLAACEAHRGG
eukprot:5935171-Pyramimonas_sp.AAC.1